MENPVVKRLAGIHKKTPAQILLRHSIQKGIGAVPKSSNPERIRENFGIFDFNLKDDEIKDLGALDLGDSGRIGNWESWTW